MKLKTFTINIVSLAVSESKNKKGLTFNKRGMIYGITGLYPSVVEAVEDLTQVELKWREWITKYNLWITSKEATN